MFLKIVLSFLSIVGVVMSAEAETKVKFTKVKVEVEIGATKGSFVIELADDKAPITVKNFLAYVDEKFYDGTIFHRVIDGFMVQGGGFNKDLVQKGTKAPINIESNNGLKNDLYTVAMARTNDPNSATAQFFVNTTNNASLNYKDDSSRGIGYTVFGKVIEGTDTVDAIGKVKTITKGFNQDVPEVHVLIGSVRRVTK